MPLMDRKAPDAVACLFLVEQMNYGKLLLKMLALTATEASLPNSRHAYTSKAGNGWIKCPEWKASNTERRRKFEGTGKGGRAK
jgi:hypothetical protein